jgi:hypothetical protein
MAQVLAQVGPFLLSQACSYLFRPGANGSNRPVLAFVHHELKLKRFARFRLTREGGHRNRESAFAKGADSDRGNLTERFDNPEISISHEQQFPTNVGLESVTRLANQGNRGIVGGEF